MAKAAEVYSVGKLFLSEELREQLRTSAVLWIPNEIISDAKLTPGAKFLYSVLLNQSWKEAVVSQSHRALASEIGASVRATRNYIDELKRAKLIALQMRPGKPGLYTVAQH